LTFSLSVAVVLVDCVQLFLVAVRLAVLAVVVVQFSKQLCICQPTQL